MTYRFAAVIKKIGINPYVDQPLRISKAIGKRGYIPAKGTLNGKVFLATLVPIGGGKHRLFINGVMRKSAGVDVGDRIDVALKVDAKPRVVPMPKDLAGSLKKNKAAAIAWKKLTPSRQKEILRYLNFAKHPETLERNIRKVVAMLGGDTTSKNRLAVIRS
ncbi:MAG TPA: YdeI/OmpD-associated family protein [Bacteroidota bacterium]|nr:YdeI/OmpD-associated family protein [Bacteroidota bacterium]